MMRLCGKDVAELFLYAAGFRRIYPPPPAPPSSYGVSRIKNSHHTEAAGVFVFRVIG